MVWFSGKVRQGMCRNGSASGLAERPPLDRVVSRPFWAIRYQACRQAKGGPTRSCEGSSLLASLLTHNPAKRVPSGCSVLPACNVLRYSVLCASSRQRGRRKLPRTVRGSYRLNGLPALPPPDAGVARAHVDTTCTACAGYVGAFLPNLSTRLDPARQAESAAPSP